MLRAAYFAQELISTFSTALGEVALQPSTGGTFIVEIFYAPSKPTTDGEDNIEVQHHVLWDRKAEGGFPETKELKRRVRDIIEPGRDLGHVDGKKHSVNPTTPTENPIKDGDAAEDGVKVGDEKEPAQIPHAISRLQEQEPESERKFTPMDVDSVDIKDERGGVESGIKRNPDGSICEDCN